MELSFESGRANELTDWFPGSALVPISWRPHSDAAGSTFRDIVCKLQNIHICINKHNTIHVCRYESLRSAVVRSPVFVVTVLGFPGGIGGRARNHRLHPWGTEDVIRRGVPSSVDRIRNLHRHWIECINKQILIAHSHTHRRRRRRAGDRETPKPPCRFAAVLGQISANNSYRDGAKAN